MAEPASTGTPSVQPLLTGISNADLLLLAGLAAMAGVFLALLARRPKPQEQGPAGWTPTPSSPATTMIGALVGALWGFVTYVAGFLSIILSAPPRSMRGMGFEEALERVLSGVTYWELSLVAAGAIFGALFARYRWRATGLLSYVGLVTLIAGYLLYAITTSFPRVPPDQRPLSLLLLVAETGSLTLVAIFAFYSLDVASRKQWVRLPERLPRSRHFVPHVAIQIPVYNEPLDVVTITVARLVAQDYPKDRLTVMVIDDSSDPEARDALQKFCQSLGARYMNRPDRRGFKAGALNYALRRSPRDVDLIGVVDADYWVEPDYVRSVVGYFINPKLGFVQTPQDYRNIDESFLTRQYSKAEAYFYHAVLPSRNEENAIIFCGTMGIIRRKALEQAGGWGEEHVCEDAELSVRLAALGWDSLYVGKSFGKGLMPAVFDAYKKQFHRWSFGNVRILMAHFTGILGSRMSRRQKFDFVAGNLHWFDGLFICAIAFALLYVSFGEALGWDVVTHHQRELALLALVPIFLLIDGAVRVHVVLRRVGPVGFEDTVRVLGMWFAIKFTNMAAALKSVTGVKAPFVRTPKSPGGPLSPSRSFARALRLAPGESAMACVLFGACALTCARLAMGEVEKPEGTFLLSVWLALYGVMFLCAPLYAYLSYRTLRPAAPPASSVGSVVQAREPARSLIQATPR